MVQQQQMHADELFTDADLVRRLIAEQLPQFAHFEVTRITSWGTDNALYRLGADMAVRMPRLPRTALAFEWDSRWLPRLAPHLPVPIPEPIAAGAPSEAFPHTWGVYRWLAGTDATVTSLDTPEGACDLARFIRALWDIDASDGPPPGPHNSNRGVPLSHRDESTRRWLVALQETPQALAPADHARAVARWEESLAAPEWDGPPHWLHGDLLPGNLLVTPEGRLAAVIDWGCLSVGDPAADVMPAWSVFSGPAREAFREALDVDDVTWLRARGWSLWQGVAALAYYYETNPVLAGVGRRAMREVLADGS